MADDSWTPAPPNKSARPTYASSRKHVAKRQKFRRSPSGDHTLFDSAVHSGQVNILDSRGRESIPVKPSKTGAARPPLLQQPALDHIVQFAALSEHYGKAVEHNRAESQQGRARSSSFDLFQAFKGAVADPDNLRILTHDEHVALGGSSKRGQFSKADQQNAAALFDKHFEKTTTQEESEADTGWRQKTTYPLPGGVDYGACSMLLRKRRRVSVYSSDSDSEGG